MKQNLRLLLLMLLCAVYTGAWATEETTTFVFTSKDWNATCNGSEANWNSGQDGYQLSTNRGVQITTGASGANATSPTSFTNISQVVVTYSTNASKGKGSIKIKIGDNTESSQSVNATGGTTDRNLTFSYNPQQTGAVKLTVDCSENSIYIKSIAITTNSSSTGPQDAITSFKEDPFYVKIGNSRTNDFNKPYNLTVTYSSGNLEIATVNETTGEVTGVESGSTTITATWASSAAYNLGSNSYTVIVPERENPNVYFASESLEVEINNYIRNTLNSPDGLTFSYSSGDETIATVADDGLVTGVSEGTTTITASWEKTNTSSAAYSAGSVSFTIIVKPETPATIFTKVKNVNQLVAGKQYIIVADDYNYAMGKSTGSPTTSYMERVEITKNGDKIKIKNNQGINILTLGGETGAWTFKTSNENKYLNYNSSGNYLLLSDDASGNTSSWTVTDAFEVVNKEYNTRKIQYNSAQPRFACYTSAQQKAVLYVKEDPITATFKKKFLGYTSIYYSDKNLVVPENVTAHTYKVEGGKGSYSVDYEAGAVIPKGTGVILEYSDKNIPDDGITVVLEETTEAGTADPDNMLRGFDTAQETTVDEGENPKNYYFYRYTVGKGNKSNKIGFYFADEEGSQFIAGAHKIYLAVLRSQFDEGVNASYIEDDSTGIDEIMASTPQKGTYTLSGIQVRTDNLPKGIYIVNGKKMVIK